MNFKKRIHIVPVGFEIDRVTVPLTGEIEPKADKVYLITKKDKDDAKTYLEKIIEILTQKDIEFEIIKCNIKDVYETLREIRKIISSEKEQNIYINLSSGSTICTISGIIASMLFQDETTKIEPYYVEPEKYTKSRIENEPLTTGVKGILDIPNYKAHLPEEEKIKVMTFLAKKGKKGTTKKKIVEFLDGKEYNTKKIEHRTEISKRIMYLNRNIIEPLSYEWKLIEVEGKRKNAKVKLTKNGEDMIKFLKDE